MKMPGKTSLDLFEPLDFRERSHPFDGVEIPRLSLNEPISEKENPFIDQNSERNLLHEDSLAKKEVGLDRSIYTHYIGSSPSLSFPSPVNETDLHQVIAEAKRSYGAWKKREKKLNEVIQNMQKDLSKTPPNSCSS